MRRIGPNGPALLLRRAVKENKHPRNHAKPNARDKDAHPRSVRWHDNQLRNRGFGRRIKNLDAWVRDGTIFIRELERLAPGQPEFLPQLTISHEVSDFGFVESFSRANPFPWINVPHGRAAFLSNEKQISDFAACTDDPQWNQNDRKNQPGASAHFRRGFSDTSQEARLRKRVMIWPKEHVARVARRSACS